MKGFARVRQGGVVAALVVGCVSAPMPGMSAGGGMAGAPAAPITRAAASSVPQRQDFVLAGPFDQGGIAIGLAPSDTRVLTLNGKNVALAEDGRFLIAFGRDAAATADLVAIGENGITHRRTLAVRPRAWRIENLNTLPRISRPSAEFQRLRAPELEQIAAARAIRSESKGWQQPFIWPATGRISGLFGAQRIYRGEPGAFHSGVDVARPTGAMIVAPADGVVVLATSTPFTLEGHLLIIDHGMGLNSSFLHMSRIDVKPGDVIRQGQVLGAVGATGRATGPHLHWGMKWEDERIDPMLLAGRMPVAGGLSGSAAP